MELPDPTPNGSTAMNLTGVTGPWVCSCLFMFVHVMPGPPTRIFRPKSNEGRCQGTCGTRTASTECPSLRRCPQATKGQQSVAKMQLCLCKSRQIKASMVTITLYCLRLSSCPEVGGEIWLFHARVPILRIQLPPRCC